MYIVLIRRGVDREREAVDEHEGGAEDDEEDLLAPRGAEPLKHEEGADRAAGKEEDAERVDARPRPEPLLHRDAELDRVACHASEEPQSACACARARGRRLLASRENECAAFGRTGHHAAKGVEAHLRVRRRVPRREAHQRRGQQVALAQQGRPTQQGRPHGWSLPSDGRSVTALGTPTETCAPLRTRSELTGRTRG